MPFNFDPYFSSGFDFTQAGGSNLLIPDNPFQVGGGGIDYSGAGGIPAVPAPIPTGDPGFQINLPPGTPSGATPGGGIQDIISQLGQYQNPILNESGAPELFQPGLAPFSASESGSTSSSGIDFSNPFTAGIMEQLSNYARNLDSNISAGTESARALSKESGRGFLEGELTTTLNSLANRGILGSSEAENIISNVGSRGVEGQRLAGLQAGLTESGQRLNAPNILAQLAQLGQTSQSTSSASSVQADPLAPFRLAGDFISGQTV